MKHSMIIILLLFTVGSCYYSDSQRFETGIYPEYEPEVAFSSNLDQLDSIGISDSLFFSFEISVDTVKLYYSDLYLGNYLIYRSVLTADSLWITPYSVMEDGEYDLSLVAFCKTYSGSLADLLDAEPYIEDTSWVVTIRRTN